MVLSTGSCCMSCGSGIRTRSNLEPNLVNLNLRFRFGVQLFPWTKCRFRFGVQKKMAWTWTEPNLIITTPTLLGLAHPMQAGWCVDRGRIGCNEPFCSNSINDNSEQPPANKLWELSGLTSSWFHFGSFIPFFNGCSSSSISIQLGNNPQRICQHGPWLAALSSSMNIACVNTFPLKPNSRNLNWSTLKLNWINLIVKWDKEPVFTLCYALTTHFTFKWFNPVQSMLKARVPIP